MNGAKPALLAQQTEFIEGRRTFALDPQTFGQQQQTPLIRHRRQRLAPQLVVDQHADVVAVNSLALEQRAYPVSVFFQLLNWQWRHRVVLGDVMPDELQDVIALAGGLGEGFLGWPKSLLDGVPRDSDPPEEISWRDRDRL